jgi:hypothetical protein
MISAVIHARNNTAAAIRDKWPQARLAEDNLAARSKVSSTS